MKQFAFVSFVLLQFTLILGQTIPRYSCLEGELSKNGEFCLLVNLNTNGPFTPVTRDASKVKEFEIRNSTVIRLTPNICQTFPFIEKFTASEVGIETLDEDTFKDCRNLKEIRILRNNIRRFDKNLFNRNTNLELLYFGINQLTEIPAELFRNLNKLDDLGFASMQFSKFPKNVFRDLRSLRTLWVYHDALLDLDAEDILAAMPQLQKIYLRDNDFQCTRLRKILDLFKARNVDIDKTIWEGNERKRNYTVSYVEGVECINDELYKDILKQRLDPSLGNRFDDLVSTTGTQELQTIHKQIMTMKEAYEYKMNELKTQHKAEMDDLKDKISIMHQNLDTKMAQMLTKIEECKHDYSGYHGHHHGGYRQG